MEKRRAVGRHEVYERTHKKKKGQGDFVTDKSKEVYVSTIHALFCFFIHALAIFLIFYSPFHETVFCLVAKSS